MRFLINAHLPPALARWIAARGHEAEHVGDIGMQTASDTAIWNNALRENGTIITKDEDFARRKVLAPGGPVVIWIRLPNARRSELLRWFDAALPIVMSAVERGDTLIELT